MAAGKKSYAFPEETGKRWNRKYKDEKLPENIRFFCCSKRI